MKKLITTLQHVLAVVLFSALGMGSLAQAEEVDIVQMAQSTTDESIAVNPRWVDLPGGGRTQFEVFGESGPFVFLGPHMYLHPMSPGSSVHSQGYVDGLSDRYRVIVADWPRGIGQSSADASRPMTADNAVADILAIADAAGAETFAWWGYSFGGAVGLQLAARTDRVSALVVGGYPPLWQPLSDMLLALHQMEDQLEMAGLAGESTFLLNQDSIHFYTSIAQINQLDLLDKITAPRMVYHDVDDTVALGGMVHDLSRRTREGADTLKARGWEIQWMETGMAHYGITEYQKNLDAFASFLDRVLLGKAVVDVVLETAIGNIEIELYTEKAPLSAGEFARYVDEGLFEGAAFFYRVVTKKNDKGVPGIEVVQGGLDPRKTTMPGIAHETTEQTGILHKDGVISLARTTPGSASPAAFFISIGDNPGLDFGEKRNPDGQGFAAFGKVTRGMDIVKKIHQMEANYPIEVEYVKGQYLTEPVVINKAYRK